MERVVEYFPSLHVVVKNRFVIRPDTDPPTRKPSTNSRCEIADWVLVQRARVRREIAAKKNEGIMPTKDDLKDVEVAKEWLCDPPKPDPMGHNPPEAMVASLLCSSAPPALENVSLSWVKFTRRWSSAWRP